MVSQSQSQLAGWKAIASYLQRDERTAMRWANERGMPVYRVPGRGRGSVYASPDALDAWLRVGGQVPAPDPTPTPEPAPTPSAASVEQRAPAEPSRPARTWTAWAIAAGLAMAALLAVVEISSAPSRAVPATSIDPAAKELLLSAAYDWNRRTSASLLRAAREYRAAIARDPQRPEGFVGLANTYLLLREYGSMPDSRAYPLAEQAAKRALALAPETADMHRALAFVAFWWRGDRASARQEFARALALRPDDPLTHHWYATALSADGERAAALREIRHARELDPTSASIRIDQGLLTYLAGDIATGRAILDALLPEQRDDVSLHRARSYVALWEGRAADYLDELTTMAQLRHERPDPQVQALRAGLAGKPAGWLLGALRAQADAAARRTGTGYFPLAQYASLAGDPAGARQALAKACRSHEQGSFWAKGDLWLSRSLPRETVAGLCGRESL